MQRRDGRENGRRLKPRGSGAGAGGGAVATGGELVRGCDPDRVGREEWNALAARAPVSTIFQTWEWHRAWWDAHGDVLEDRTRGLRSAGRWTALLPLAVDSAGTLRLAGDGMADYMDALVPRDGDGSSGDGSSGDGSSGGVAAALAGRLWDDATGSGEDWRRAELRFLPERAALLGALAGSRLPVWSSAAVPCPRSDLADPSVARELPRKKSLRRHHNHFRKQPGYRVEHLDRAAGIEPHLDAFFEQHVARWAGTPTPSLFRDERPRRFYRALVRRMDGTGWLRFTRLSVGELPIAFHLGFVYGNEFVWYKPSFDPQLARRSPGEALLKELLDRAIADGLSAFDFTVGDETFKSRFASSTPVNRSLTVYRSRLPWVARRIEEGLKSGLKRSRIGRRAFATLKGWAGR